MPFSTAALNSPPRWSSFAFASEGGWRGLSRSFYCRGLRVQAWAGIFLGWTHPYGGEDASLLPATRRPLRFDFRRARLPRRVGTFLRG